MGRKSQGAQKEEQEVPEKCNEHSMCSVVKKAQVVQEIQGQMSEIMH